MAHSQMNGLPAKLSFAKVVAMPVPNVVPALPNISRDHHRKITNGAQAATSSDTHTTPVQSLLPDLDPSHPVSRNEIDKVRSAVESLRFTDENVPLPNTSSGDSLGDDQSQLSASSLKQHSFETKSMASVTTFAMDEKESIRPDDSASVRAVDEDDPPSTFSRQSSFQMDTGSQPHATRAVLRNVAPNVTIAARRYPGFTMANPPRFGDLPLSPATDSPVAPSVEFHAALPTHEISHDHSSSVIVPPDEKLLEALTSPKDRLPLLQLEEKVIAFINQTREDMLELPPQNSFNRLLTHKLADYYGLAHHVKEDNSSVRISRNTFATLPPSLADIARSIPIGPQHASIATQVKIMRRAHLGARPFSTGNSTAASSSVPSKTTSENGGEFVYEEGLQSPSEGTPSRDRSKLTREEREAQYKAARDRIFSDFQESVTSESGSTGETSASISRSSSSSGRKKARKHKAPKDDSFDSRSAFVAYGPMQMHQATHAYNDTGSSGIFQNQGTSFANNYKPNPVQPYPPYDHSMAYAAQNTYGAAGSHAYGNMNGWHPMQQVHQPSMYGAPSMPTYQQQTHMVSQVNNQYIQGVQTIQQPHMWSQNQYQHPYAQSPGNAMSSQWQHYDGNSGMRNAPYQHNQALQQNYTGPVDYTQGPVPSSYGGTRSLFNPRTRSFVPNHGSRNGRNNRKKGSNSTARGSDASGAGSPPATGGRSDDNLSKTKEDSLQQKYGTPPTLPKKPPPSQVPPHFSGDAATNNNQPAAAATPSSGPLVINGSGRPGAQ